MSEYIIHGTNDKTLLNILSCGYIDINRNNPVTINNDIKQIFTQIIYKNLPNNEFYTPHYGNSTIMGLTISLFSWVFLPAGYPESVSRDYLAYQIWDTAQGFLGYLKQILLSLSFLRGMGVGQESSSLSHAMQVSLVRDSVGVISGLVVGIPTFTVAFSEKRSLKTYRIVSEVVRIVAGLLEIYASVYSREYFLHLSCVIVVLNTIATVMVTQTRASLVTHFACTNNVSDCAAKEGNQDRGVKVFGIPLAVLLLKWLGEDIQNIMNMYVILVVLQLMCNVLAVGALDLDGGAGERDGASLRDFSQDAIVVPSDSIPKNKSL